MTRIRSGQGLRRRSKTNLHALSVLTRLACRGPALILLLFVFGAVVTGRGQNTPGRENGESPAENSPDAHLGRGYADLKNDRYDEAAREFRAALALDPTMVLRARFPLGIALFKSQKVDEARREFEAVRAAVGDQPDVMYYLGRLNLMQGNLDDAIRDFRTAASKPPFPDTAFYLGSSYLKKGGLGAAEKWLREAASVAPGDFHIQEQLGTLYQREGRKPDAERAFAQAEQIRKRDAETDNLKLACVQKLDGSSLDAARPVCERLFDADDPGKLTVLGTLYGEHGDFEDALRPLQRAAELDPASPQMQYNLALACFRLKRYDEAKAALLKAVKLWPDLFELNSLLGVVWYRLGDGAEAYEALSHAHALNPEDAGTAAFLYEVSIVLAEKRSADKEYALALACLRTAAGLRPDDPEPHRRMAEAYTGLGQPEQAEKQRRMAEQLHNVVDSK